jgi:hypothetical protein
MSFTRVLRLTAAATLVIAALCGCQGDDNSLPLPLDAGSHADATTVHDGGAEGSTDSGSKDSSPDVSADASEDTLVDSSNTSPDDATSDASSDGLAPLGDAGDAGDATSE